MRSIWIVAGALLLVTLLATTTPTSAAGTSDEVTCVCPRNMVPVCGSDNRTYSNRCLLHCQMDSAQGRAIGLRMSHKGRCGN